MATNVSSTAQKRPVVADEVDVVLAVPGNGSDLGPWLQAWSPTISKYNVIAVLVDPAADSSKISLPAGQLGKVLSRSDVQQLLGSTDASFLVGNSFKCVGWALSRRKYVVVLDLSCQPAKDPKGLPVDPVAVHHSNLQSPSTPYFFNTLYDPYREGADFVRGYPFSLREGLPTAVSHGLWMGAPDMDAATALAKPHARNDRYVDAVLTVPKNVMYPMSLLNLAFDRTVGAAMFVDGSAYDDVFAGWCLKVVCDHLGMGHKTGLPYVSRAKSGATAQEMQAQAMGLKESAVQFLQGVKLSAEATTPEAAYLELATKVRSELGAKDAHFTALADSMAKWVAVYKKLSS